MTSLEAEALIVELKNNWAINGRTSFEYVEKIIKIFIDGPPYKIIHDRGCETIISEREGFENVYSLSHISDEQEDLHFYNRAELEELRNALTYFLEYLDR